MIKLEHVITASPEQMEFIIEGMRNPMNSWDKSDSVLCPATLDQTLDEIDAKCSKCPLSEDNYARCPNDILNDLFFLGENDESLMKRLVNAGTDHRKFMRQMPVYVRITAPLYWWKEFDTYKVGTVSNSCSTMHKIQEREFTLEDFSDEHLTPNSMVYLRDIIGELNRYRDFYNHWDRIDANSKNAFHLYERKDAWWQMIQLLPSSYNQTRNVSMNYEVLANIYKSRKAHKLNEWREFCSWIETLPYSWLITGNDIVRTYISRYDGLNPAITVIDEF